MSCHLLFVSRSLLLMLGLGAAGSSAAGQTATPATERIIAGVVIDAEAQTPIVSADVVAGGARATTDAIGRFSVRVAAGQVEVLVTAAGHFPLSTTIDVRTSNVTTAELALARDAGFETSVAVVGSASTIAPAAESVAPVQVMRTPGAFDNVYRTLPTLPGVAATDEFGSLLSVRGGSPDQNLTMMDGVEVHDPYRLFGLTSAFNPETIQRFELASGGFSVKYGDRLSSLVLIENRDGRANAGLNGSVSLNLSDANVVFEGGLPGGANGSWLVTGRRTYYDVVAERMSDQELPGFQDLQARATWAPSDGARVTFFGLSSRQTAALDIDEGSARGKFQDDTKNDLAWLRVDASIGARAKSRTIVGFSDTRSRFAVDAAFQNASQRSNAPDEDSFDVANVVFERALAVRDYSVRQEIVWQLGAHVADVGFEAHRLSTSQRFENAGDPNPVAANGSSLQRGGFLSPLVLQGGAGLPDLLVSSQAASRAGAWLQDTWQATTRASLQGGLRLDRYQFTGETLLSPRVSGIYSPGAGTRVIAAVGLYRQGPGYEKGAQSNYVLDFTSVDPNSLSSERAWLSSVGVERELGAGITLKVEGYDKRFTDVLIGRLEPEHERLARISRYDFPAALRSSVPDAPLITTVPINGGQGRAYGFDVFLNRPGGGRLTGWTSYTWGRAEREAYGRRYPFEYDRRHAFTLVSAYALTPRWEVAATTRIASGFPRTAARGVRVAGREDAGDFDRDGITDEILPARDPRGRLEYAVDFGDVRDLNNARLPSFVRVDARITWRPRGIAGRWELYMDVINALNWQNAGAVDPQLAYDATSDRPSIEELRHQAIPLLPSIGLRFRF